MIQLVSISLKPLSGLKQATGHNLMPPRIVRTTRFVLCEPVLEAKFLRDALRESFLRFIVIPDQ